jgi:hypothetical protein
MIIMGQLYVMVIILFVHHFNIGLKYGAKSGNELSC